MAFTEWMEKTKIGQLVSGLSAGVIGLIFIGIMYMIFGPTLTWLEHIYRDVLHLGPLVDWFENVVGW